MKKKKNKILILLLIVTIYIGTQYKEEINKLLSELNIIGETTAYEEKSYNLEDIPQYDGIAEYIIINNRRYQIWQHQK